MFNWPSLVLYQNEKRLMSPPETLSDEGFHAIYVKLCGRFELCSFDFELLCIVSSWHWWWCFQRRNAQKMKVMSRERLEAMKSNEMHRLQIIHVHYQQSQTKNFHFFSRKWNLAKCIAQKLSVLFISRVRPQLSLFPKKMKSYKVDRLEITHVHYQQGQAETFTFCKDQILVQRFPSS